MVAAFAWSRSGRQEVPAPATHAQRFNQTPFSNAALSSPAPPLIASAETNDPQAQASALKDEAISAARQVADSYPNDALTFALLGSAYYNTGRSEEAVKYLRKCLELNPSQADAYDILARVAYEKGQLEETIRLCREALARGGPNLEVLNRLGRALMDSGQTEEAIQTLEQAVRGPNPVSESFYLLGQANLQAGKFAPAKESFQRAVALVPDHTQAYFGLFTVAIRTGQEEEAERYRKQFEKLEASDRQALTDRSAQQDTLSGLPLVRRTVARTLFGAAQIYRVHKQPAKAAELFRRAATLDEEQPLYRAAMEAHFVQTDSLVEGVHAFEQLTREQPQNVFNHYFLGRLQSRLNQLDDAERAFRRVQELAPNQPEGYRSLVELYLKSNRQLAAARELAERLVKLEPTAPHYHLLALTSIKNNDRAAAIAAMERALALQPEEKRYHDVLRQLKESR